MRRPQGLYRGLTRLPVHGAVVLVCGLWLLPTVGLLVSSFRPARAVATTGWWTAWTDPWFTLENYRAVLHAQHLATSFANSLVVTVPATAMPILVAAFAAYALAWMEFPGRRAVSAAVVVLLAVPLQTTLVPVLRLFTWAGLAGTFPAVWLAHTAYGLPFAIFLLRNFFTTLPRDVLESASLDGASPATTFFRLVLPMSAPAVASLAVFQFLWVWNDLLVALVYLGGRPAVAPLTVTVSNLVSSLGGGWHLLTAAAFVSMALPLAVFVVLQGAFVRGVLAGAVKG